LDDDGDYEDEHQGKVGANIFFVLLLFTLLPLICLVSFCLGTRVVCCAFISSVRSKSSGGTLCLLTAGMLLLSRFVASRPLFEPTRLPVSLRTLLVTGQVRAPTSRGEMKRDRGGKNGERERSVTRSLNVDSFVGDVQFLLQPRDLKALPVPLVFPADAEFDFLEVVCTTARRDDIRFVDFCWQKEFGSLQRIFTVSPGCVPRWSLLESMVSRAPLLLVYSHTEPEVRPDLNEFVCALLAEYVCPEQLQVTTPSTLLSPLSDVGRSLEFVGRRREVCV
jgi:hypothetical protein